MTTKKESKRERLVRLGKTAAYQEGYNDAMAYLKEGIIVDYKLSSSKKGDPIYTSYWTGWNKAIDNWHRKVK